MTRTNALYIFFYDLDVRPRNLVRGHCTPFTQRYSLCEVWAILGNAKRRYAPDKGSRIDRRTEGHKDGRTDRRTD